MYNASCSLYNGIMLLYRLVLNSESGSRQWHLLSIVLPDIAKVMSKLFFNLEFSINKKQGREIDVTSFHEKFKNLNIFSQLLEISIKCHKRLTRDQNFWFKSTMLPELKVYAHGLSPWTMQKPYSKFILGIKSLFVNRFLKCLLHILRQV